METAVFSLAKVNEDWEIKKSERMNLMEKIILPILQSSAWWSTSKILYKI